MTMPSSDCKTKLARKAEAAASGKPAPRGEMIFDLFPRMENEIKRALPSMVDPDQFIRACITTVRLNPDLQKCAPISVIGCAIQTAQLGLAPDSVLGQVYWVPFWNSKLGQYEATFQIGYRGYLELIRRTGQVLTITAREVYKGDHFELEYGLEEKLVHRPALDVIPDPRNITHVYAVAHMVGGGHAMWVMTRSEVEAIRRRSKASDKGPWVTDWAAMARKTVIRQLAKLLPLSVAAQRDMARDETITRSLTDDAPVFAASDGDVIDVVASAASEANNGTLAPNAGGNAVEQEAIATRAGAVEADQMSLPIDRR